MEILSNLRNYIFVTQKGKSLAIELKKLYNANLNKVSTFIVYNNSNRMSCQLLKLVVIQELNKN